eukprot:gene31111-36160_t
MILCPEVDGNAYLTRLADRSVPVAPDAPFLLPPRPPPPAPRSELTAPPRTRPFRVPQQQTDEQRSLRRERYEASVARPASSVFTAFADPITSVVPSRAWVLRAFLSAAECDDVIRRGEAHGLSKAKDGFTSRTSKRTNDFMDEALSALVSRRLPAALLELLEASPPHTAGPDEAAALLRKQGVGSGEL